MGLMTPHIPFTRLIPRQICCMRGIALYAARSQQLRAFVGESSVAWRATSLSMPESRRRASLTRRYLRMTLSSPQNFPERFGQTFSRAWELQRRPVPPGFSILGADSLIMLGFLCSESQASMKPWFFMIFRRMAGIGGKRTGQHTPTLSDDQWRRGYAITSCEGMAPLGRSITPFLGSTRRTSSPL